MKPSGFNTQFNKNQAWLGLSVILQLGSMRQDEEEEWGGESSVLPIYLVSLKPVWNTEDPLSKYVCLCVGCRGVFI